MIMQVIKTVLNVSVPVALAMFGLTYLFIIWRRRRRNLQSRMHKASVLIPMGVVSFVIAACGFGWFNALSTYTFGAIAQQSSDRFVFDERGSYGPLFDPSIREDFESHRAEILRELWIDEMLPPSLRAECYSDSEQICKLTQSLDDRTLDDETWYSLLVGMTTASVYSAMIWAFVLRKRSRPQPADS